MLVADDIDENDIHAYPNRPVTQRFLTIFAGPATNYLFAIFLAVILFFFAGVPTGTSWWGVSDTDKDFDSRQARLSLTQADTEKERKRMAALSSETRPEPTREELEKVRPLYERGAEYFRAGKFDLAVTEWESIWNKYPGYENLDEYLIKAYQYWGMELYTQHKYDEALEIWQRILKVDSNNEKALRYIQRTQEELGQLRSLTG